MKKYLFILLISTLLISCGKNASDVRQVKSGISTKELKYIMGEPREVLIQNGKEEWYFNYYNSGVLGVKETLMVTIVNDKVITFMSY